MNMGSLFQTIKLLNPAITNTKTDKLQKSASAKSFAGATESKNLTFRSVLSKFMNEKNKTSSNASSADNTLLHFLNALLFVLSNTSGTDSSGENHAVESALESWLSGQFNPSRTKSTDIQAVFQGNATTTNPNTGHLPLSDIAEGLKTGKTFTVYLGSVTLELQLLSTGKDEADREELSQNLSKLFKLLNQFVSANTSENASSLTQKKIDGQNFVQLLLPDGSKLRITIKEGELDKLPDSSSQLSPIDESLSRIAEEKSRKLLPGNPSKSFNVPDAMLRKLQKDFTGRNSEISNDLIAELKEGISRFTGEHFEFAGERVNGVKSQIFVKLLDNENNENDVGNMQIHRAVTENQEYKSMNQTQPDSAREEFKVLQKQYIEKDHLSEQADNHIKAGLSSSPTARTVSGQAEEIQNHSRRILQEKDLSNNLAKKTAQKESGNTHQNFSSNPRESQLSELIDRFAKLKLQSIRITPKMSFKPLISEAGVVDQSRIEVQQSSAKVYRDLPSRSPSNPKGLEPNKEPESHQTGERTVASSEVKTSGSDKENAVDIAAPNRHSQNPTTINTRVDQVEITSLNQRIQEIMKNALNSRENVISIRFQLVPKELGQIELEIVREAEKSYRVIFTLHRDEAKEIIEKSLPVLRERLKEEGVEHVKFEFTHSRDWADDSENEENPNSNHHNQREGYRRSNSSFKAFLKEVSDSAQLGG